MKRSSLLLLVLAASTALCAGCSSVNEPQPTNAEADAIRDQIMPCWHFPAEVERPENYRVPVEIEVTPEGKVAKWSVGGQLSELKDPTYMNAMQQAIYAVNDPACQPIRFPPGKYWPRIKFVLDPTIHG